MKISDVMTRKVQVARPDDTVAHVARLMSEIDVGAIPIMEYEQIVGVITDRDIVIRVVGENRDSEIPVSDVMTTAVVTCRETESLDVAIDKMSELQLRRMIIVNENGKMSGILSLGDVAKTHQTRTLGQALEDISV